MATSKEPLTTEDVLKIAKLANLKLSDAEVEKFAPQLGTILEYLNILQTLDTEHVVPTAQVTGLHSVTRPDSITKRSAADDLLAVSPLPKEDHQLLVPAVFS
ncbi:Asp-tRNA(Asn)/Glu-tRNA(Gln) amidotransferase subunit GatC [Candidatus Gracilibacteria bacterium]|nr:Asp-tRNA(Asn)/Glu-tRNA(Gln) amidotransferase subunit GatC [Candidatus Gracilibacteria bacterium]